MIPCEDLMEKLRKVLKLNSWQLLQRDFNESNKIYIIGNGGNLAVADHASVDITRLTSKVAVAPGSGILATSIIGDSCIDTWFVNWLSASISVDKEESLKDQLVIGISSSGTASNILNALIKAKSVGMRTAMLSARSIDVRDNGINTVMLDVDYYHSGEVLSLLLTYQLIHGSGSVCPSISEKLGKPKFDRLVNSEALTKL